MKTSFEQQWLKRFQRFAEGQTDAAIAGWSESGLAARFLFFQRYFKVAQPGIWIDLGCGAGTYSRWLHQQHLDVIAIDYSHLSLQKAKQQAAHIPWLNADALSMPLKAQSCDGLICFGVVQAVEHESDLISEVARVCKPNAQLWMDGLNQFSILHLAKQLKRRILGKAKHLHYTNPWKLKKLVKSYGFEQVKIYWAPILPGKLSCLNQWISHRFIQAGLRCLPMLAMLISHAYYIHATRSGLCKP